MNECLHFSFLNLLSPDCYPRHLGVVYTLKGELPVPEAKTEMEPRQSMSSTQDLPLEMDSSKSVHHLIPFLPPSRFTWTQFWKLPDVLVVWGQKQTDD